jgi:hypothetical protein
MVEALVEARERMSGSHVVDRDLAIPRLRAEARRRPGASNRLTVTGALLGLVGTARQAIASVEERKRDR